MESMVQGSLRRRSASRHGLEWVAGASTDERTRREDFGRGGLGRLREGHNERGHLRQQAMRQTLSDSQEHP